MQARWLTLAFLVVAPTLWAQDVDRLRRLVDTEIDRVLDDVVEWRRDFHAHPELSFEEFRTAGIVADHLRQLGLEVRTEVARTGVVGVLRGGRPGPVVALRADMDGLPVTEETGLPYASTVRTTYNGQEVGVMHACGHDNHVAILMGVAEALAGMREELPGTVMFLFQPAEEGSAGAAVMLREGAFDDPQPDAVFGLHVLPGPVGTIEYRSGGYFASSDALQIVIKGRQTHAAMPWGGVDPIVAASQVVLGLQTVVSRQVDITASAAVVSIGMIHGGVRGNIIPDSVVLTGTIRTLSPEARDEVANRVEATAMNIAEASGATATVTIVRGYPVTVNDPALVARMLPTLQRVAGEEQVIEVSPKLTAEDFSYFANEVPGFYIGLQVTPPGVPPDEMPRNHSPLFTADERALPVGVRAMAHLALDYLAGGR